MKNSSKYRNYRVCGLHFHDSFRGPRGLKSFALPTLNLPGNPNEEEAKALEALKRTKNDSAECSTSTPVQQQADTTQFFHRSFSVQTQTDGQTIKMREAQTQTNDIGLGPISSANVGTGPSIPLWGCGEESTGGDLDLQYLIASADVLSKVKIPVIRKADEARHLRRQSNRSNITKIAPHVVNAHRQSMLEIMPSKRDCESGEPKEADGEAKRQKT